MNFDILGFFIKVKIYILICKVCLLVNNFYLIKNIEFYNNIFVNMYLSFIYF